MEKLTQMENGYSEDLMTAALALESAAPELQKSFVTEVLPGTILEKKFQTLIDLNKKAAEPPKSISKAFKENFDLAGKK